MEHLLLLIPAALALTIVFAFKRTDKPEPQSPECDGLRDFLNDNKNKLK